MEVELTADKFLDVNYYMNSVGVSQAHVFLTSSLTHSFILPCHGLTGSVSPVAALIPHPS